MTKSNAIVLSQTESTALQMLDGMAGTSSKQQRRAQQLAALAVRHDLVEEQMALVAFVHVEYHGSLAAIDGMLAAGRTVESVEGAYECREHLTTEKGKLEGTTVSLLAEALDWFVDATPEYLAESLNKLRSHWNYSHRDAALRRLLLSAKERQVVYLTDYLDICNCN